MENQLEVSTEPKKWMIMFKSDKNELVRSPIPLSQSQMMKLRLVLAKPTAKFVDLHDDGGVYIETLPVRLIDGIRPINRAEWSGKYRAICGFGVRHVVLDGQYSCQCHQVYGAEWFFREWLKATHKHIQYPSDVTDAVRSAYLNRPTSEINAPVVDLSPRDGKRHTPKKQRA